MFSFDHCGCSRSLRFDLLISRQKTIARGWRILCMRYYVSASRNTVSFELVKGVYVSIFLSQGRKLLPGVGVFYVCVIMCLLLVTLFHLNSFKEFTFRSSYLKAENYCQGLAYFMYALLCVCFS